MYGTGASLTCYIPKKRKWIYYRYRIWSGSI